MIGRQMVTNQDLKQHQVTVPDLSDAIWNPLYDYQTYPAAGSLQLTFFALPIGQGTTSALNATGGKTEADTNLSTAGLLAQGNRFYCTGLEVQFWPGSLPGAGALASTVVGQNWNDVSQVARTGWLKFRIQNRDYALDSPLGKFPPTTRLVGAAALADSTTAAATKLSQIDYASFGGQPYRFVPQYIVSNQNFNVFLNWPALVPTPSTVAGRIGVRLNGYLIRDAQ